MAEVTTINVPQGDFVTTTLNGAISNSATTMTIGTGLTLDANGGFLQIDYDSTAGLGNASGPETIAYTSYTTGTGAVTGITRAQGATTAVSHANGASVQCGTSAKYILNGNTLGYAQITADFTTATAGSYVDVTSLTTTFTVPAGGRRIKVTAWSGYVSSNNSTQFSVLTTAIREGSTVLANSAFQTQVASANIHVPASVIYSVVPSVGAHTYKVSVQCDTAGTTTFTASATSPAFILVELI